MSESNKPLIDPEAQKLINRAHKVKTDNLALFDIKDFQADPDKIEEVEIKEIGKIIRFKRLTIGDLYNLPETKTRYEYTARIIWMMMNKADPTITYSQVQCMYPDVAARIFDVLAEYLIFLHPNKVTSESGLTKT